MALPAVRAAGTGRCNVGSQEEPTHDGLKQPDASESALGKPTGNSPSAHVRAAVDAPLQCVLRAPVCRFLVLACETPHYAYPDAT
jgi:hypothetical protein